MTYAVALICKLVTAVLSHKIARVRTEGLVPAHHAVKAQLSACAKFTTTPGADGVKQ